MELADANEMEDKLVMDLNTAIIDAINTFISNLIRSGQAEEMKIDRAKLAAVVSTSLLEVFDASILAGNPVYSNYKDSMREAVKLFPAIMSTLYDNRLADANEKGYWGSFDMKLTSLLELPLKDGPAGCGCDVCSLHTLMELEARGMDHDKERLAALRETSKKKMEEEKAKKPDGGLSIADLLLAILASKR
jgi:hypothetical protein